MEVLVPRFLFQVSVLNCPDRNIKKHKAQLLDELVSEQERSEQDAGAWSRAGMRMPGRGMPEEFVQFKFFYFFLFLLFP